MNKQKYIYICFYWWESPPLIIRNWGYYLPVPVSQNLYAYVQVRFCLHKDTHLYRYILLGKEKHRPLCITFPETLNYWMDLSSQKKNSCSNRLRRNHRSSNFRIHQNFGETGRPPHRNNWVLGFQFKFTKRNFALPKLP